MHSKQWTRIAFCLACGEPDHGTAACNTVDQAWFWSPEWQAAEREIDEDLAAGRFETFDTVEAFLTGLY